MLTALRNTLLRTLILIPIVYTHLALADKNDRKDQNKQAAAMSMMAAGMAFFSCAMLLAEAAKTKDPRQKAMMTMMGTQQCAQGAQTAAAGQQNDKNAKQLTEPQKVPETKVTEAPRQQNTSSAQEPAKEANLIDDIEKAGASDKVAQINDDELIDAPPSKTPDFSLTPPGTKSETKSASNDEFIIPIEQKISIPKAVEVPDPGFKVKNEVQDSTTSPGGTFASLGFGSQKNSLGEDTKKATEEVSVGEKGESTKRTPASDFFLGADADLSTSSSSSGSSDMSFEGLMAQYMGGGAAAQSAGLGTSDVVFLPKGSDPNKPGTNIFQYASFRYRKAAYNDGLIRTTAKSGKSLRASLGSSSR